MSLESNLYATLRSLCADRVYPDVAPDNATAPYITYQQIGGQAVSFVEAAAVGLRNARVQVNCWSSSRITTADLARNAEDALITALRATPAGAMYAVHEPDLALYGTHQDFSIWY